MQNAKGKDVRRKMTAAAVVVLALVGCLAYAAINRLLDKGPQVKRHIQTVTLIKPPPPVIKEKPPEPEVQKKEEIVEQEEQKPEDPQQSDEPPPGQDLGVDAEGSGAGDQFGLVGKKGGRALIGSGDSTLMQRYAWYTRLVQEEIRKRINEHLSKNGGLPDGDHKALVKIVLDDSGRVVDYQLFGSSGDPRIDEALKITLADVRIGETPPDGMPRAMRLKVSSKG